MKAHFLRTNEQEPCARCVQFGQRAPRMFAAETGAMGIDDLKKRFIDEIRLRAYADHYIDKNEEREILQVAIAQGIGLDAARRALAQVCEHNGYVLESTVLTEVKEQLQAAFGSDGKIDQKRFDLIFQNAKRKTQGKKQDLQVKRLIVEVMEDSGMNKVKTGWFSNWYGQMKKEVGMM